jgi:hypothetical protein
MLDNVIVSDNSHHNDQAINRVYAGSWRGRRALRALPLLGAAFARDASVLQGSLRPLRSAQAPACAAGTTINLSSFAPILQAWWRKHYHLSTVDDQGFAGDVFGVG